MITFIKKILGIDNLEYKIRLLERKNYWRDKYKAKVSTIKKKKNKVKKNVLGQ